MIDETCGEHRSPLSAPVIVELSARIPCTAEDVLICKFETLIQQPSFELELSTSSPSSSAYHIRCLVLQAAASATGNPVESAGAEVDVAIDNASDSASNTDTEDHSQSVRLPPKTI